MTFLSRNQQGSSARVQLAMPEHCLYSQQDRRVTASVVLGLRQSVPSGKEIKAISV